MKRKTREGANVLCAIFKSPEQQDLVMIADVPGVEIYVCMYVCMVLYRVVSFCRQI